MLFPALWSFSLFGCAYSPHLHQVPPLHRRHPPHLHKNSELSRHYIAEQDFNMYLELIVGFKLLDIADKIYI
jgi:hypothetical protein